MNMEYRKGMMKTFLLENLRALMIKNMFEKITIKQICDETGVIRATFYNYFDDKYDCLNSIVYHDLVEKMMSEAGRKPFKEIIHNDLTVINENLDFYRAAYNVTGQNSFEDMIRRNLALIFTEYFRLKRKEGYMPQYSNDLLANYYAECIAFDIRTFVFQHEPRMTVEQTEQMLLDLMNHSLSDFSNPD